MKSEVGYDLSYLIQNNKQNRHIITEDDFKSFPKPIQWIANCSDCKVNKDGINLPGKLQAIWEYPDRELLYFDGLVHGFIYK